MEPTFQDHEYLIIDEISYRLRAPERGEVIVFRYPKNPRQYYIKRVIGLPGETIVVEEGHVYIVSATGTKERLDETTYLDDSVETRPYNYNEITLADNEYFVMGDNRTASYDSRQFGPLEYDYIVGRAFIRVLPIDRVNIFNQ